MTDGIINSTTAFHHELPGNKKNDHVWLPAATVTTRKVELLCLACEKPISTFDHLKVDQEAGPWYCDHCGVGHYIKKKEAGVFLTKNGGRKMNTLVLLKLRQQTDKPVHIVVEGVMYVSYGQDVYTALQYQRDNDRYFYNEHTCPSNFLGVRISENGDADPHGVFEHVETIIKPDCDAHGHISTMAGYKFPHDYLAWMDLFPILQ